MLSSAMLRLFASILGWFTPHGPTECATSFDAYWERYDLIYAEGAAKLRAGRRLSCHPGVREELRLDGGRDERCSERAQRIDSLDAVRFG
jgi:hypothetical protein